PGDSSLATVVAQGLATSFAATRTRVAVLHLHGAGTTPLDAIDLRDLLAPDSQSPIQPSSKPLSISYRGSSSDASIMLGTQEFAAVLNQIKTLVDVVLIDASSEGASAEMTGAARHADSALVVIEPGRVKRETVRD